MTEWLDVSSVTPRIYYTVGATPQTVFTVPFIFFEAADLKVYVDNVLKTLSTHYTVAGTGEEDGGTVTFLSAQSNVDIGIVREIAIELLTHIPSFGPLDVASINLAFSRFIAIEQQLESRLERSVRLPDADAEFNTILPLAADRANLALAFDGDGAVELINSIGAQGISGGTTQVFDTRAQAIGTAIDAGLKRITINAFSALSPISPADYIRGTSTGPLAFQDTTGAWWQVDLSGGVLRGSWCGIKADSVDDTIAFALMVSTAKAAAIPMLLPPGFIRLTAGSLIDWHGAKLWGAGLRDTNIIFDLAAGQTGLTFYKAGDSNGIAFPELRNLAIYKTGALQATALDTVNTSKMLVQNVNIQDWTGSGNDVGWAMSGRELLTTDNVTIAANLPIRIKQNPDRAAFLNIDCDFLHLQNMWLIAIGGAHPNILIDDGVNVTELLAEHISMNGGSGGLTWTDTTSSAVSERVTFRSCRFEQSTAGAFMFLINRTSSSLYGLHIEDCHTGYSLLFGRGIANTTIEGQQCENASGTEYGVNLDGANCETLTLLGNYWATGTRANLPDFAARLAHGVLSVPSPSALPTSGEYVSTRFGRGTVIWKGPRASDGQQAGEWTTTVLLVDGDSIELDPFSFFAVSSARIDVFGGGQCGTAVVSGAVTRVSGTSNFSTTVLAGNLAIGYGSATSITLYNNLGTDLRFTVQVCFNAPALF